MIADSKTKFLTRITAAFFGVGFIPFIPATWASAVAAILAWFLREHLIYWVLAFTAIGLWACRPSQSVFNSKDPKEFVMDEVCGMMLSLLWIPHDAVLYVCGFFLFRFFDAWKPWPISKLQQSAHPSSIVTDDLAAGIAANICLRILIAVGFRGAGV